MQHVLVNGCDNTYLQGHTPGAVHPTDTVVEFQTYSKAKPGAFDASKGCANMQLPVHTHQLVTSVSASLLGGTPPGPCSPSQYDLPVAGSMSAGDGQTC